MSPMADQEDENDFSDSGLDLDLLPQSTLRDLEHNAISSTQQQVAARRQKQYHQVTRPFKLSAPSNRWPSQVSNRPSVPPVSRDPSPPSSDYGFDEEDVIDLDEPPLALRSNLPVTKPTTAAPTSNPGNDYNHSAHVDASAPPTYAEGPIDYETDQTAPPDAPYPDLTLLDSHIKQLEAELASVRASLQNAQATNQKQTGEISIIRAKQDKDAKDYESKIALMQKLHADEVARQKADIHTAKKDLEAFETHNRFLEHDLAQTRDERSKRLKPTNGHKSLTKNNLPQLSQNLPYRDGFDDHEIVLLSPSKPKDRSKPPTPKVGDKRKRNITVSPVPSLQLNAPLSKSPTPVVNTGELVAERNALTHHQEVQHAQFQMIQRLMNHRPLGSQHRALEILSRLSFPSLPDKSVAGLIAEALSMFTGVKEDEDFSSYSCSFLSDLWATCLSDSFYTPVYVILDLYEFVVAMSLKIPEMALVERFIPLATKTIDLIAVPRARPSADLEIKQEHADPDSGIDQHLLECIDVDQILSLLHSMAFDTSLKTETCQAFWRKMEFDFTLMMLNKAQPLPHIMLVLQMVGSSAMSETFGVITDPDRQAISEVHTIDRLTTLLFERPEAPPDEPPYEDTEIARLQVETIRALNAIAITKHGSSVLAQHRTAIGRLVRLLHVQVTRLYDLPSTTIEITEQSVTTTKSSLIHELTATLINLTVRLIYHLLTNQADLINLRERLMVIPGGHHKFLVSLTRLAFSEQLVYEAGIEEEAVDAAHEILDGILSPEEGEAVVQAIETPRGTRASAPG